jgi:hypothetical protein
VNIKTTEGVEIPCEVDDHDDGQYFVKYQVDEECTVNISVLFQDDKQKMVPLRGSPYQASFVSTTPTTHNSLSGPLLPKYITKTIEQCQSWIKSSSAEAKTNDKDLTDIKQLLGVVDAVKEVNDQADRMLLNLD